MKGITALLFLSFFVTSSLAATITVSAGLNTLSAAIADAEDGDVLVLLSGVYTESTTLELTKELTIRGASPDSNPVLEAINVRFSIPDSDESDVTLQGLSFTNSAIFVQNAQRVSTEWGDIAFLQNSFTSTSINTVNLSGGIPSFKTLTFVGNTFAADTEQGTFRLYARESTYVAGNEIAKYEQVNNNFSSRVQARDCFVMGNEIEHDMGSSTNASFVMQCTEALVYGNSFVSLSNGSADNNSILVWFEGGANTIKNNVFKFADNYEYTTADFDLLTMLRLNRNTERESVVINNIFDYSNEPEDASTTEGASVFTTNNEVTVSGNIFYNYGDYVPFLSTSTFNTPDTKTYNLCFGGETCINGDTNTTADPEFVDLTNYVLGDASPAIDAGDPADRFNDIDGSRNDVGVQGGSFPYSQYQSQLADSDKPFIYPLFEAAGRIAPDNQLVVDVLAVARNR